jgi:hypothetical protein
MEEHSFSVLYPKMEAGRSSKTLVLIYRLRGVNPGVTLPQRSEIKLYAKHKILDTLIIMN